MKKVKFNKKLVLNKETISNLNNPEMSALKGGETYSVTCRTDPAGQCAAPHTYYYAWDPEKLAWVMYSDSCLTCS